MNANELADEVEMWGRDLLALNMRGGVPVIEGARLLRQQQAEIEALKKENWLTEIDAKQQALKQIIDWIVLEHDSLACSSYPMSKENRK